MSELRAWPPVYDPAYRPPSDEPFWFRELDIWPVGDVSVRKTFGAYVVEQSRWSFDEAAALFAPRRSFLARYLWQIADATP